MALSCERMRWWDFWLPVVEKPSVCAVSVDRRVSGKREVGHTCDRLAGVAQGETGERNFLGDGAGACFIPCPENVSQCLRRRRRSS